MKIHPGYRHFDYATNASMVREYIEEPLCRKIGSAAVDDVQVTRVFPRRHDGFTVQYELRLRGGDRLVLCGHLLGSHETRPSYIDSASDRVIWIDPLGLAVPVFPYDPKLKALEPLYTPQGTESLAKKLGWPTVSEGRSPVHFDVMGYRLGKRCVIRLRELENAPGAGHSRQAVAKVVGPQKLDAIIRAHNTLAVSGLGHQATNGIGVPKTLVVDEARSVHVMEYASGVSLHDLAGDDSFEPAYDGAARVLSTMHAIRDPKLPRYGVQDEIDQLMSWVSRVSEMFPEQTERFEVCRSGICKASVIDDIPQSMAVCIHRDFYDKQVLFDPDLTTLLDCDNIAIGDPAQDYGNFAAHVTLRGLQHPERVDRLAKGLDSFAAAYPAADAAFYKRSSWWQSATLLRLAALYALRPRWRHLTEALLDKAEQCAKTDATYR